MEASGMSIPATVAEKEQPAYPPQPRVCPTCKGDGHIWVWLNDDEGDWMHCHQCRGSGVVRS